MHLLLAALLLLLQGHDDAAHAASITLGQVVHFDATYSACSAIVGFEALHASNNGVLFLGDASGTSSAGYSNSKPAIVAATEPTHTHTGAGLTSTIDDEAMGENYLFGSHKLLLGMDTGTVPTGANAGITDAKGSNLPFVQVLACRVAAAGGMELPAGGILSMDPGSSTSTAIKVCPSAVDYSEFTLGAGRFMVAAPAPLQATPYAQQNSAAALTSSTYATFGDHQHTFASTITLTGTLALGYFLPTKSYADEGDFAVTGSLTKSNINLPFKVAKQCQAITGLTSPTAQQLPVGALVFFAAPTCPEYWSQAPAQYNLNGRLIVTMNGGANLAVFGSTTTTLLSTSTSASHAHASLTGARVQFAESIKLGTSLDPTGILFDNTGYAVKSAPSGATAIGVPTVHVLLCRHNGITLAPTTLAPTTLAPTKLPTPAPTKQPTLAPTNQPTQAPTLAPTLAPTKQPTLAPTKQPTRLPTASPTTSRPTKAPTTSRPTQAPTPPTKQPTRQPTASPTSSVPTQVPTSSSPTRSPTKSPTTSRPTQQPTSSRPTHVPSASPTPAPTKLPSLLPTASPTKQPTLLPTGSPTTSLPTAVPTSSKPTRVPSKAPTQQPTLIPTALPTASPTRLPTLQTTSQAPSPAPSAAPTTSKPTLAPTTAAPTTLAPSTLPTVSPTRFPTAFPTVPVVVPVVPEEPTTVSPTTANDDNQNAGINDGESSASAVDVGMVVGAVIGALVVLAQVAFLVHYMNKRQQQDNYAGAGGGRGDMPPDTDLEQQQQQQGSGVSHASWSRRHGTFEVKNGQSPQLESSNPVFTKETSSGILAGRAE